VIGVYLDLKECVMGLYWNIWTSVSDGGTGPGAPVTAVPWGNTFALFLADPNGGVHGIKAEPGYGWEGVPGRTTKPGAQITAVESRSHFTLFMADVTGEVFTNSRTPYQSWNGWTSVSEGSTTPGAPIAAIPWDDSFALFYLRSSRAGICDQATPGFGWEAVPGLSTKPGAPVTALLSGNSFTLFAADVNGEIFMTSGAPHQGWAPWTSVPQGSSLPGAPLAAVPWGDSFALFIADPSGGVYAIKATPGYGWDAVPGRTTKPGGQITVVPWNNPVTPQRFLLFMVDVNGQVLMTSGLPYQGWDAWISPSDGASTPGAPVTVAPSPAQLLAFTLFIADPKGGVYTTSPAPPPTPTGLHLISVGAVGAGQEVTAAWVGWNAVPAPGSVYKIYYLVPIYEAGSLAGVSSANTNQCALQLADGHSYSVSVQAAYIDGNIGVVNGSSAALNAIVVTALPVSPLTPSVTATVEPIQSPPLGTNYSLLIKGSNFGKNEQVSVTVAWSITGESGSVSFPLGVLTTSSLDGSFFVTFTGRDDGNPDAAEHPLLIVLKPVENGCHEKSAQKALKHFPPYCTIV
jgi:hypothetical protein